ncbi:hypothetical protein N658DRAFT_323513 [Parathielavia hyrcaniae]|uniref:Uncharacterized protein n=1 Tax=Parathielavia hyrcaniae TaxID=113614 RepID=A0AAN6Q5U1_9PEZI|nr:hypothetical protein N658DRAFT_323513 [Parathielavia hyrcaniae]
MCPTVGLPRDGQLLWLVLSARTSSVSVSRLVVLCNQCPRGRDGKEHTRRLLHVVYQRTTRATAKLGSEWQMLMGGLVVGEDVILKGVKRGQNRPESHRCLAGLPFGTPGSDGATSSMESPFSRDARLPSCRGMSAAIQHSRTASGDGMQEPSQPEPSTPEPSAAQRRPGWLVFDHGNRSRLLLGYAARRPLDTSETRPSRCANTSPGARAGLADRSGIRRRPSRQSGRLGRRVRSIPRAVSDESFVDDLGPVE